MSNHSQPTEQRSAGDWLVARFRAPLMSYFLKRVHDHAEAEDLTQEVFARLTAHPDRDNGEKISSYVFTIAANLLRDRARMYLVRRPEGRLSANTENVSAESVEEFDPERVLLGKEALKDILTALSELNPQARDIFILSRLEKVPQREIARLYGISVSAVEKHVIRTTAFLGARLKRS